MSFKISLSGPLIGRTCIPGDLRLTLTTLAMCMLSHEEIVVTGISPSPDITRFLKFLENYGATIDYSNDSVKLRGRKWNGNIEINNDVPDSIIHIVIGSTVFATHSVKIKEGEGKRSIIVKPVLDLLKTLGLKNENISGDGKDIIIDGTVFSPPGIIYVYSAWEFEAVIAAAASFQKEVVISYPLQLVTHLFRLLALLGFQITHPEGLDNQNIEISRRLARSEGEKSLEIRKFEWTDKKGGVIKIPGDSTIAAAVCGSAAIIEKSDVTVEGVIWEQGRRGFFDALNRMKINFEWEPDNDDYSFDSAIVRVRWSKSEGIHLSTEQALAMSSELLILGSVAAFATDKTVISDDREFPGLEKDSFKVFAKGLEKLGADIGVFSDGIVLNGAQELTGNYIDSGGNPDVALALTITALNSYGTTTISGFIVDDYPVGEFLKIVKMLNQK